MNPDPDASPLEQLRFWMPSARDPLAASMLLDVMEQGLAASPEDYAALWLPYMEAFGLPTFSASNLKDLDRLSRLLPASARVALALAPPYRATHAQLKEIADAFLASPGLPLVRQLVLSGDTVGALWSCVLACAEHGRLEELTLRGGSIFAGDLTRLIESPAAPVLRSIQLYNGVAPEDLLILAASPHLHALRTLDLGYCPAAAQTLPALVASPHLAGLEHLHLTYGSLGPEGAAALANAWTLPRLRSLSLGRCELGDTGLRALARNPLLQSVTRWDLHANHLGPDAAHDLAALDGEDGLELLNLTANPIGDAGALAFAACPRLTFDTLLTLSSTRITDVGARALAMLPCRHLDLHGNPLTDAGWDALWKQRGSIVALRRRVRRFERTLGAATPHTLPPSSGGA